MQPVLFCYVLVSFLNDVPVVKYRFCYVRVVHHSGVLFDLLADAGKRHGAAIRAAACHCVDGVAYCDYPGA